LVVDPSSRAHPDATYLSTDAWNILRERLRAFAGQAVLYAQALHKVTGRSCNTFWLHQPIAGTMTRVAVG
jgi:hypothetical protein